MGYGPNSNFKKIWDVTHTTMKKQKNMVMLISKLVITCSFSSWKGKNNNNKIVGASFDLITVDNSILIDNNKSQSMFVNLPSFLNRVHLNK